MGYMGNTVTDIHSGEAEEAKRQALKSKVLDIFKVSTVPTVLKKIIEITDDPLSGISDLEAVIEHDQAIASRVVAVSNAVYYGFPRKISSIHQAILVLGFEMVKGLAVSSTIFNVPNPSTRKVLSSLWGHSFEVAMASVMISKKSGLVNKEIAFLAGLLHDIGRPILIQVLNKEYLEVCAFDRNCLGREKSEFGADHAEAGTWFIEKCKLPEDCVHAIRYHHTPEACLEDTKTLPPLVKTVYLANLLSTEQKDKYAVISPMHSAIMKDLGVTAEELDKFSDELSGVRSEISAYYD